MPKKHSHTDTTLSLAPMTVDEALAALLKTPPPAPDEKKGSKTPRKKVKRQRR
jgi:hypothetical protein